MRFTHTSTKEARFGHKTRKAGFTLMEILVVIAIIGLLAAIVLASLSGARKKSRDARRVADLKQIENAIHLYVSYNAGVSPATLSALTGGTACGTVGCIAAIPPDPSGGTAAYGYVQLSGGGYVLGAILETVGQVGVLVNDYDGTQNAMSINGIAAGVSSSANCNANAGGVAEVVYCLYSQ